MCADGDPDLMRQGQAEVKNLLGEEEGPSQAALRSRGSGQRQEAVGIGMFLELNVQRICRWQCSALVHSYALGYDPYPAGGKKPEL